MRNKQTLEPIDSDITSKEPRLIIQNAHALLATLVLGLLLTGCGNLSNAKGEKVDNPFSKFENNRPKRCLALSGGGIRSAAVTLGVLQELSDSLGEFDYVSSVSGGGYPIYGILHQLLDPEVNISVNELLDEDSDFISHIENNSDFVSFGKAASTLGFGGILGFIQLIIPGVLEDIAIVDIFTGKTGAENKVIESAFSSAYANDIHDTYSGSNKKLQNNSRSKDRFKLADIPLNIDGFPRPIFVASRNDGTNAISNRCAYSASDLFELSPEFIGSKESKYYTNWVSELALIDAVVASSAAPDTPRVLTIDQKVSGDCPVKKIDLEGKKPYQQAIIPGYLKALGFSFGVSFYLPSGKVFLSDGGFIENQAVLPLVNRQCEEIIALDASADYDLKMEGWYELAKLVGPEWEFIPPILKGNGWELPGHVFQTSLENKNSGKLISLTILKLGLVRNWNIYDPTITDYARENHQCGSWAQTGKPACNNKEGFEKNCAFPLEDTVDQSFTPKEFRAYRFLGKHLVEEMRGTVNKSAAYELNNIDCDSVDLGK